MADDLPMARAARIVDAILRDMNGRRGLSLDGVDEDVRSDIREAWIEIVTKGMAQS